MGSTRKSEWAEVTPRWGNGVTRCRGGARVDVPTEATQKPSAKQAAAACEERAIASMASP